MTKALTIVAAGVLMALPAAAGAQSASSSDISEARENARVHLGPFYATPALQLKELGVDSNVFNTYGDDQKSDFTFTLVPKADVWVPMAKRALVQATGAADLVYYAKYDGERSVDPQGSLRGEFYLNRITLFGEGAYLNSRQRPNQEIDIRARHTEEKVGTGVDVALTPEVSVELVGHQLQTRYDETAEYDNTSLQRTLNRDTSTIGVKGKYRVSALTSLAVRYDRQQDRFTLSPERDSDSYRVMPGVEFKPRALINGSAYVGYREFTPADPAALPDFSGLVAQLGLSYTLLGATTFGVSYSRDLTYSYDELQPFFIDNSVGASIRRALGRRFDTVVSADRHAYDYKDLLTGAASLVEQERIDTTWTYAANIGYRIAREGRIAFGASYWTRDSTTREFRGYDNLKFGTSMTLGF